MIEKDTQINRKIKINFKLRWEYILILILSIASIINGIISPQYLSVNNLLTISGTFMEKGIIGLVLLLLIISGNVDISVASILAFSSAVFSISYQYGVNIILCIFIALAVGAFCGFFNGIIVIKTGLPSILVTLINLSLFRGMAYVILKDKGIYGFPEKFLIIGPGKIPRINVPYELIIFIVLAVITGIVLHKTYFGKRLYIMGLNRNTAFFSGINTKKITIGLFTFAGFIYAFSGILLMSRIGSVRPNIATNFELEIITIIVFGGAAIFGGTGTIAGYIISLFTIGAIRFGLGLRNLPGEAILLIIGSLLILSILINNIIIKINERRITVLK